MAVGDIVSEITTAAAFRTFQPAATVTVMVLFICNEGGANHVGLTNGVNNTWDTGHNGTNYKVGINNTNYLYYYGTAWASFSGIQTQ